MMRNFGRIAAALFLAALLADFESGRTFALPAPYTLQARFDTDEHFFDEALSAPVPIAFIATSDNAIYVVFRGPSDGLFNHSSCNYYPTLCDKTDNPTQCKARAEGRGGCSV